MAIFDKINSFLNSSCLDLGYIVITFFIIILVIAQFSLLINGIVKAISGGFALEFLTLFFNIAGSIYSFSGIEDALSNNCPILDLVLKLFRRIGYFLLFIEFLKEGGFELLLNIFNSFLNIFDFFLDVFNGKIWTFNRRPLWGIFKVFLIWIMSLVIGCYLSQIMNNYISWLCNCGCFWC